MPIRKVNGFMASCLNTQKKKGINELKKINIKNYNGVDVKKVGSKRNSLIGYLAKYVTKNNVELNYSVK